MYGISGKWVALRLLREIIQIQIDTFEIYRDKQVVFYHRGNLVTFRFLHIYACIHKEERRDYKRVRRDRKAVGIRG